MNKPFDRAVAALSRIFEIGLFAVSAIITILAILTLVMSERLIEFLQSQPVTYSTYLPGLNVTISGENAVLIPKALFIMLLAAAATWFLSALIFRNVNLILRTSMGKTDFSIGPTPFQPVIVRMIKEIGILSIIITVVYFIAYCLEKAFYGNVVSGMSIPFSAAAFGVIIICLSRVFAYGMELQQYVNGLV